MTARKTATTLAMVVLILTMGIGAWAEKAEPEGSEPTLTFIDHENYDPSAMAQKQSGIRVSRVVNRADLPGGPWAGGEIGDYILESSRLRVIVRGEGRPPQGSTGAAGTGNIVDIALRDQMWDSIGGITQFLRVGQQLVEVGYTKIEILPAPDAESDPFLLVHGTPVGFPKIEVVTMLRLDMERPHVLLETRIENRGESELAITVLDQVNWGALPIFVGGYGVPTFASPVYGLVTPWVCGVLDDFCLGVVSNSPAPLAVAQTQGNRSYLRYGVAQVKPGTTLSFARHLVATRGDMAPVSTHALALSKGEAGVLQGTIRQETDQAPIPGATVEIRRFPSDGQLKYTPPPYAVTRTDLEGKYSIALPPGGYVVFTIMAGRPQRPTISTEVRVEKGKVSTYNILQTELRTIAFEVVDEETGESLPAKLRFVPQDNGTLSRTLSSSPAWRARGARLLHYLKPGPNAVPVNRGTYQCIFSRGLEYDTVSVEIEVDESGKMVGHESNYVRASLKRCVPTKGMVAVDLDMATEISPISRVSAEDLVLAAAGEGLEWVVSGDLGRVTDLSKAVRAQGLEKWLRVSSGVHLSYQHKALFGEFYLFPVPADTTQMTLDALAGPETTSAQFFKAARTAFPDALICVTDPAFVNTSYLLYFGMDAETAKMPDEACSLDFDAIVTHGTRDRAVDKASWRMMEALLRAGHFRHPLSISRTPTLYYDEPGYPRTYLVTGKDDIAELTDADLVRVVRSGRYFITNGPIIEHAFDGKWPRSRFVPDHGEYIETVRVLGAPWVELAAIIFKRNGRNSLPMYRLASSARSKDAPEYLRFPVDDESTEPLRRRAYTIDSETRKKTLTDSHTHLEVAGASLGAILTQRGGQEVRGFAITPPVLVDGNGDGVFRPR